MACNDPIPAWRVGYQVFLRQPPTPDDVLHEKPERFNVPCGKCFACRKSRIKDWTLRCSLEASLYPENSFLTLTYDPKHLPSDGSLVKRDYQLFLKKLRKKYGKIRYFVCGEYGEKRGRPHYHMLLFGFRFPDQRLLGASRGSRELLYTSDELTKLWSNGLAVIGEVNEKSINYVARYVNKKLLGACEDDKLKHYGKKIPEFIAMSLKPGIGALFFERYYMDFFPKDFFMWNGFKYKPPRYFEKLWKRLDPELLKNKDESLRYFNFKEKRYANAIKHSQTCSGTDLANHDRYLEHIEQEQRRKRSYERG